MVKIGVKWINSVKSNRKAESKLVIGPNPYLLGMGSWDLGGEAEAG